MRLTAALMMGAAFATASLPDAISNGRALIAERLPRIVHRGGPFLRHPQVITVTFAGDDQALVARLERFGDEIVRSAWWRSVTEGYCASSHDCIASGLRGRAIRLPRELPERIRDVDVEALLEEEAARGALGSFGDNALVVAYLPAGVVLSDAFTPRYCDSGPRAFHRMLRHGTIAFPFAVVPRCGNEGATTASASHEILEAATNADPNQPGFRLSQDPAVLPFAAAGAEPADACNLISLDRRLTVADGFIVQRAWSNRAAAAGSDPCVPSNPDVPYVAVIPRAPVVRLPAVGATATVLLDAASDRGFAGWEVSAVDLTGEQERERYLEVRVDRDRVVSGDTVTLTVRVLKLHARQLAIVGLISRVGSRANLWPLAVSMR